MQKFGVMVCVVLAFAGMAFGQEAKENFEPVKTSQTKRSVRALEHEEATPEGPVVDTPGDGL